MITLRRADQRHHERRRKQDVWHTFDPRMVNALAGGFGTLEVLDEDHLPPGVALRPHPAAEREMVTYVREGALAHEDSMGRAGVIHAGEFRRTTGGGGTGRRAMNASRTDWAHVLQIGLGLQGAELEPSHEQRRFCAADRRGVWCVVGSPDGRRGSLRIQGALLYSAMLDPGRHVVHEIAEGRSAWLHVVKGEVILGDLVLTAGDGAGFTAERSVSLTARAGCELLLIDMRETPPRPVDHEGAATPCGRARSRRTSGSGSTG